MKDNQSTSTKTPITLSSILLGIFLIILGFVCIIFLSLFIAGFIDFMQFVIKDLLANAISKTVFGILSVLFALAIIAAIWCELSERQEKRDKENLKRRASLCRERIAKQTATDKDEATYPPGKKMKWLTKKKVQGILCLRNILK